MAVLIFLFGALLALGLFFIAADFLKLPRLATQRAMLSVGRQEKKQARSMEALLMGWAVKLAPHIHMDEYKRSRLKNTLNAAGMGMTPEVYSSFATRMDAWGVSTWFMCTPEAAEKLIAMNYDNLAVKETTIVG